MFVNKNISAELLRSGFNIRITARGSSMSPSIVTGDRITVSPEQNLRIGDIILFRRGGEMVCHRLVRVFEKGDITYYQTRGDSFFSLDKPVTSDQILGRVTKIERVCVSLMRRILLLIHPILKLRINAFVIAILRELKAIFPSPKSH
jgi:signal peptidase I